MKALILSVALGSALCGSTSARAHEPMPSSGSEPASGSSSRGNEITAALSPQRVSANATAVEAPGDGRSAVARMERPVGATGGSAGNAAARSSVEAQATGSLPREPAVHSMRARPTLSWKSLLPGSIQ